MVSAILSLLTFTSWCLLAVLGSTAWRDWRFDADGTRLYLNVKAGDNLQLVIANFCEEHFMIPSICESIYPSILGNHVRLIGRNESLYDFKQLLVFQPCMMVSFNKNEELSVFFDAYDDLKEVGGRFCRRHGVANCDMVLQVMEQERSQTVDTQLVNFTSQFKQCPYSRIRRLAEKNRASGSSHTNYRDSTSPLPATEVKCLNSSCRFRNLYYHEGRWIYTMESVVIDRNDNNSNIGWQADGEVIYGPVLGGNSDAVRRLPLETFREEDRKSVSSLGLHQVNSTLVLIERYQPFSHGHILHDSLVPIFWALRDFTESSSPSRDVQVVVMDKLGPLPHDVWFEAITEHVPIYQYEIDGILCPQDQVCWFKEVVFGYEGKGIKFSRFGEELETRRSVYNDFLAHALKGLNCPYVQCPTMHEDSIQVIIIQRLHYRIILNISEIKAAIKDAYPSAKITTVIPDYLSPQEQLDMVRSCAVLIAIEGGALDNLLFAPPGTKVVVIGRDPGLDHPVGCAPIGDEFSHIGLLEAFAPRVQAALLRTAPYSNYHVNTHDLIDAISKLFGVGLADSSGGSINTTVSDSGDRSEELHISLNTSFEERPYGLTSS